MTFSYGWRIAKRRPRSPLQSLPLAKDFRVDRLAHKNVDQIFIFKRMNPDMDQASLQNYVSLNYNLAQMLHALTVLLVVVTSPITLSFLS
jgi:hypothetical protein